MQKARECHHKYMIVKYKCCSNRYNLNMTVSKSTGSASVPPLSISHAREGISVSVLGNSNRQGHQKPLSHEGNDKNASDADISMDLLAMPDPPTPDTRVHCKMSAAALEMP